jgi:hypothetical protein
LCVKIDYRFSVIIFGASREKSAMFLAEKSAEIVLKNLCRCVGYLITSRFGLNHGVKEA